MNRIFTLAEIEKVAEEVIQEIPRGVICFDGEMGVGKTTLIKSILRKLGASDSGSSPTFGLVNEYHNASDELLAFHFDFYRINDESEALDMGWEDYLNQDAWVFVEWPEKIPSLLPYDAVRIKLHFIDENTRSIEYNLD